MTHTEPRAYYVTMLRGKRVAWLAGPFDTHKEALSKVDDAKREACRLDVWADFDAFGTASVPRYPWNPKGKLNSILRLDSV
jgi:hypothetical protein